MVRRDSRGQGLLYDRVPFDLSDFSTGINWAINLPDWEDVTRLAVL